MKLHEYFDRTYLINLDSRTDRLAQSTAECGKYDILFERFQACDGSAEIDNIRPSATSENQTSWNKGSAGLCVSTIKILEQCQKDNLDSVLIMEDDVEFNPQINNILDQTMSQIPDHWESIFFGLSFAQTVQITENIGMIKSGWSAHCFAINRTVFQYIIELLSSMDDPADIKYSRYLFPRGKSYVVKPFLAWQRPSLSNIRGYRSNLAFLRPPETLEPEEIREICTEVCVLEDRLSKYKKTGDPQNSEKLSLPKITELCWKAHNLEDKLVKYENCEKLPSFDSLSPSEIRKICFKVSLLEEKLKEAEDKLERLKAENCEFPFREAKNIQSFINNKMPSGSKRRSFAKNIYKFFRKKDFHK
jgi:GR25 family glycosyltransferase involved in LPS biosynthesis